MTAITPITKVKLLQKERIMKQTKTIASALLLYLFLAVSMYANAKSGATKKNDAIPDNTPTDSNTVSTPPATNKLKPMAFFSGMVLTKVTLQAKDSLAPFANVADENYQTRKAELAGLLIFHLADKDSVLPAGAYVWDGEKWQAMSQ